MPDAAPVTMPTLPSRLNTRPASLVHLPPIMGPRKHIGTRVGHPADLPAFWSCTAQFVACHNLKGTERTTFRSRPIEGCVILTNLNRITTCIAFHLSLAFTIVSAIPQSSGVLMSNASSPSRMNGITASPLMVLVCHTASVLTTSSPAVCTYTSGNSPVWLLCQGVSFNRYGMSGSILKPCAIHILPGCSLTLRTARTLSAFLSDCSRFTALAIVSALRKGEVHRRIATMSARVSSQVSISACLNHW